ncbi:MAG: SsrA-binding protein SmpB [Patescibacteria group bacterium]|nr:SsrA-binding protein SmpB [Patescibacteria group bacterium]MDD5172616.1 SsrA-binding protein SmpB [Patescibacteria group bacterium]
MKVVANNKKAYFDYEVIQTMEAGIVLSGPEVKSIKNGRVNLVGSYVYVDNNNVPLLINAHVDFYPPAAQIQKNYNPTQTRKLLLHKKEISSLAGKLKIKGLSLIPLKIYVEHQIIKVQIGLVKGKKKWDKRESIKKREIKRKIEQSLKY